MAAPTTQILLVALFLVLCSAWAEKGTPECHCPQGNGYNLPYYGYNVPNFGNNFPNSNNGKDKKDNSKDTHHMYTPGGMFMPPSFMYMMPQWPMPHGAILKGEKGEPGVSAKTPPYALNEEESTAPERDLTNNKYFGQKGEKGDRGLTGPRGFRGEVGPAGPPGQPATITKLKPSSVDSQHDKRSLSGGVRNIQGDDQFGSESSVPRERAAFTVAMETNIGPTSEPVTLKFTHVTTNLGNSYNTETGQFVAPAPGLYMFSYHILAQHSKPMEVKLHHNDKTVNSVHSRETGGYTGVSNSATLALEKGDIITLVLSPGIYYVYGESGHHTTFTGYLLYPD